MAQVIRVSLGAKRYVGGTITETTGKDIHADTVQMSLGSDSAPAAWVTPAVDSGTGASITVKLLVDNTVAIGTYYVWAQITDTPEVEPMILDGPIYVQ